MAQRTEALETSVRIGGVADTDAPESSLGGWNVLTFVLAGRAGERLRPLTERRCKPAVPFGGTFRVVDFTLMNCVASSLSKVHLLTQHLAETLASHCESRWGYLSRGGAGLVQAVPPRAGERYLGTADAVYRNYAAPRRGFPDAVLVLSGDHVYHADYRRLLAIHARGRADVTVLTGTVPVLEASSFGVLEIAADGRVTRFVEKPDDARPFSRDGRCSINLGVYCFEPRRRFTASSPTTTLMSRTRWTRRGSGSFWTT